MKTIIEKTLEQLIYSKNRTLELWENLIHELKIDVSEDYVNDILHDTETIYLECLQQVNYDKITKMIEDIQNKQSQIVKEDIISDLEKIIKNLKQSIN